MESQGAGVDSSPEVITSAARVRELAPNEAAQALAVRLRGVVTFVYDAQHCFVQDSSSGIFVGDGVDVQWLRSGDEVEVEGVSAPGDYAPIVRPAKVERLGRTQLPIPRQMTYEDLETGSQDSQWVEVTGHVRAVFSEATNSCILEIASGGGRFTALVSGVTESDWAHLVDSQVRVTGVCATWFNKQRQLFGVWLMVPRIEDVVVQKPAADGQDQPAQRIGSLMSFTPHGSAHGRRVKVAGTVSLQQPGRALFVQDNRHGLYVQTRRSGRLQPGDVIELLGFPVKGDYTPVLEDATWRKVGSGRQPKPVFIGPDEALKGAFDCQLVSIEGRLVDQTGDDGETVLLVQAEQHVFSAHVEGADAHAFLKSLQNGSHLRLTGVCRIEVGDRWRGVAEWRAKSFRILLRSASDVQVLALPPWWTLARLLWAVGLLVVAFLAALMWVSQLRRKVVQQTTIIRQQLDREAALKERYQDLVENANDVVYTHDLRGQLTSMNKAGEQLLQRNRESIVGSSLLDFVAADHRSNAAHWLERVIDGGAPATVEWDFSTPGGDRVKLEISTRLIHREGRCVEVEGIGRDVTERRRLEQEILEISKRERIRIGYDLHDGVCQQLAGIVFLSDNLAYKLDDQHRPEAAEAKRITDLLNSVNRETRGVARGLFPVRLEENGLASALEELADSTGTFFNIRCQFHCEGTVNIADHNVANHLYYIAQEAMLNAVKHGNAKHLDVRLKGSDQEGLHLSVRDDGVGLSSAHSKSPGMGIRIMHYRARTIGAELELRPGSEGGTEVICRLPCGPKTGGV